MNHSMNHFMKHYVPMRHKTLGHTFAGGPLESRLQRRDARDQDVHAADDGVPAVQTHPRGQERGLELRVPAWALKS